MENLALDQFPKEFVVWPGRSSSMVGAAESTPVRIFGAPQGIQRSGRVEWPRLASREFGRVEPGREAAGADLCAHLPGHETA